MTIVEAKKITKIYKHGKVEVRAIDDINFKIDRGDFAVIAGPSGSGKTTILNIIGAMDSVTQGKIIINQQDISVLNKDERADFRRDKIGFIFQSYNLIPVLTVYENIEFALDLCKKHSPLEKKDKIHRLLRELGIFQLKDRRPPELSGGQQQRVAIARALIKDPILVLADEPTANLDTQTGKEVLDLMVKINLEKKTTFIFSSHDIMIIEKARRVIKLRDGKIEGEEYDSKDGF
ncbi:MULTISPECIES: ABC transporter ATP-binding protein [Psychrilyobacter]|uniref:ATP-binding cassette domain-containing protein n=1 Tax=Psychrilyobacter piezotolerans TaxID=2293438 RepID=A0ABX9KF26_9FUSO|nr:MULTISPECIES: ABC transporter ATP-binding protein [Psychrilyobacter]MCS5421295.1 ABC transporter ATP-binding protein [Psychrilyobacter sp. S5]NDI78158.1 ABC transporter ATP-binding protein [Psychrilyobacter piezotolerans]RDE60150.1 ABC transporter ATP-binding protein [Psychrilyobacter sp. S5]REI40332.1 ATP-binding cassette domain-containing protein [Psychrilyobacter piezotolerans]